MAASCVALKRTLRSDADIGSFSARESPAIGWSVASAAPTSASATARASSEQHGCIGPPSSEVLLLASSAPPCKRQIVRAPRGTAPGRRISWPHGERRRQLSHPKRPRGRRHEVPIHRLDALGARAARLPFSLKILLENLLRGEDG